MLDFLHHLFIPRESNNHRSKLLHHQSLLLTIVFLLAGLSVFSYVQKDYPSVLGITANISVQDLLDQTNQKRRENGLQPLALNSQLTSAAEMKAADMFAKNYWAHVSPDGTTPWVFIKNSGYDYLYAGENLARGFTTATETTDAWMGSPTHRENLLSSNYKEVGFAVKAGTLTGSDTILVVQEFGNKYNGNKEVEAPLVVALPKDSPTSAPLLPTSFAGQAPLSTIVPTQEVLPSVAPVVKSPGTIPDTIQHPASPTPLTAVAAIQNKPLVDSKSTKRNISLFLLILFIVVFVIDAVVVERKKIARIASHNLDHIIFLAIILIAAIIIGAGAIL
jgi:uncharacterized protein YkwD